MQAPLHWRRKLQGTALGLQPGQRRSAIDRRQRPSARPVPGSGQASSPACWGVSTRDGLDAVQVKVRLGPWELPDAIRENPLVESHDLGDIRHRISWKAGDSCWKKGVARSVGPTSVGRHRHANRRCDPAPIESVTLNDHYRSPESRPGTGWRWQVSPPDLALSNHHSDCSRIRLPAVRTNSSGSGFISAHTRLNASVTSSGA